MKISDSKLCLAFGITTTVVVVVVFTLMFLG